MVDKTVIEVARRNLIAAAALEEAAFWRAYAQIEDAALLCTQRTEHDLVMGMLDGMLRELGKIPREGMEIPVGIATLGEPGSNLPPDGAVLPGE